MKKHMLALAAAENLRLANERLAALDALRKELGDLVRFAESIDPRVSDELCLSLEFELGALRRIRAALYGGVAA